MVRLGAVAATHHHLGPAQLGPRHLLQQTCSRRGTLHAGTPLHAYRMDEQASSAAPVVAYDTHPLTRPASESSTRAWLVCVSVG